MPYFNVRSHGRKGSSICVVPGLASMISGCAAGSLRMLGTPGKKIPQASVQDVHRERVRFPEDIIGRPTLLLIALTHQQQRDIDTWLRRIDEHQSDVPSLHVLELPVLGRSYVVMKPYIDGGMRSGIPDPEARAREFTLYTDNRDFRRALGLGQEDRIYAVLADSAGAIQRVEDGPVTSESLATILNEYSCLGAESLPSGSNGAGTLVDTTHGASK